MYIKLSYIETLLPTLSYNEYILDERKNLVFQIPLTI